MVDSVIFEFAPQVLGGGGGGLCVLDGVRSRIRSDPWGGAGGGGGLGRSAPQSMEYLVPMVVGWVTTSTPMCFIDPLFLCSR